MMRSIRELEHMPAPDGNGSMLDALSNGQDIDSLSVKQKTRPGICFRYRKSTSRPPNRIERRDKNKIREIKSTKIWRK